MNRIARALRPSVLPRSLNGAAAPWTGHSLGHHYGSPPVHHDHHLQQIRGITVRVYNGNVEQALGMLGRRMRESGMESLIKKKAYFNRFMCDFHVKDSTRRYFHKRKIQYRIRNQELFRTLRTLLAKKMSGH